MTERMRVVVDDEELRNLSSFLDELIFKKTLVTDIGVERLDEVVDVAAVVESEIQATVDRLTAEIMSVADEAAAVEADVQATIDRLSAELIDTEDQAQSLKEFFLDIDFPGVDRASRMILYRIPGLREALRLLYQISMLQRTLGIEGIRGPLTAAVVTLIYLGMSLTQLQRRQERLEAKVMAMERDINIRLITMEEAVRGYGELPQRYRTTVVI